MALIFHIDRPAPTAAHIDEVRDRNLAKPYLGPLGIVVCVGSFAAMVPLFTTLMSFNVPSIIDGVWCFVGLVLLCVASAIYERISRDGTTWRDSKALAPVDLVELADLLESNPAPHITRYADEVRNQGREFRAGELAAMKRYALEYAQAEEIRTAKARVYGSNAA